MKERPKTILPAVAHRILGAEYHPDLHHGETPAYEEDRCWFAWSDREVFTETPVPPEDTPITKTGVALKDATAETGGYAPFITAGTRRTVDEIRDFFDGGHRAETTGDVNINQIWASAGICFQLVAIVDHAISSTWSVAIDSEWVKDLARDFNTSDMVNLYFFRDLVGGCGVGGFSPVPRQDTRWNTAFAAVEDWEELGSGRAVWDYAVRTAAHELGHLLKLSHHEDSSNLMWPWISAAYAMEPLQIMVAHEHARHYLEESHRLCLSDRVFRGLYMNKESNPLLRRAYLGERLEFDERRG